MATLAPMLVLIRTGAGVCAQIQNGPDQGWNSLPVECADARSL